MNVEESTPDTERQLARALLSGPQRWGWEFRLPPAPATFPDMHRYPAWVEPPPPDMTVEEEDLKQARDRRKSSWTIALLLGVAAWFIARTARNPEQLQFAAVLFVGALVAIAVGEIRVRIAKNGIEDREYAAEARKIRLQAEHAEEWERVDAERARFDQAERTRFDTSDVFFPVAATTQRVDVFGGTPEGRAALLATMGCSTLATGTSVHVLDLTGLDVASGLLEMARLGDIPREHQLLTSRRLEQMLAGIEPADVAAALGDAVSALREDAAKAEARTIDRELMRCVVSEIGAPLTFARIADALDVLRSAHGPDLALTSDEIQRMIAHADLFTRTERRTDALHFAAAELRVLATQAADEAPEPEPEPATQTRGARLVVQSVDSFDEDTRAAAVSVAFHVVARMIRGTDRVGDEPELIIAGVDAIGRRSLENSARLATAAGRRLVYLFDRLREDAVTLIGSGAADSAAVFMNLSNQDDAEVAARFIGHDFTFRLTQVSRQLTASRNRTDVHSQTHQAGVNQGIQQGEARQVTKGRAEAVNVGVSEQPGSVTFGLGRGGLSINHRGRSVSFNRGRSLTRSWGEAVTKSRTLTFGTSESRSVQQGTNVSTGESASAGTVFQRVREYAVEPKVIQNLDATAFVLCDRRTHQVVAADCYPGIAVVDRVSDRPALQAPLPDERRAMA